MTDRFMSHREEFEEYRDDAAKNIQALATATSQCTCSTCSFYMWSLVAWRGTPLDVSHVRRAMLLVVLYAFVAARDDLVTYAEGYISETERVVWYSYNQ